MALPMMKRKTYIIFRNFCRNYGVSVDRMVRVRFAPSPTGMMHLGGLRTALFNYLFAKSNNGKFLLRIEDTDMTRKVDGATEKIEDVLNWAGLVPDESPRQGGEFGPYLQSRRIQLYQDSVEKLLNSGHCYHCFCTEKRLALLKKEAIRRQETPKYDNKCRDLTQQQVQDKLDKKVPYVTRFKYEAITEPWTDLVYGEIMDSSTEEAREGDFVVIKSDGFPTYHFANVVDDHHMQISHVLRGMEWSVSTPKHLQMYSAFGWQPPQYAHLPLILNRDGTKLSKRQGDIHVESFKNQGIEPDALLNYLTTVNRGFSGPTDGKTLQELVQMFSLDLVNRHSSRLQPEKLGPLNRKHLQRHFNGNRRQEILNRTRKAVKDHFGDRLVSVHVLEDHYIEPLFQWAIEHRISSIQDLTDPLYEFIWITPTLKHLHHITRKTKNSVSVIEQTIHKLKGMTNFVDAEVKSILKCQCKELGMKTIQYMGIVRASLSEQTDGPPVSEMLEILGKQESLRRLEHALAALRTAS
ncbi:probable glutamate--tRNA ligase, mitochondrial [Mya arenaria]|uniref:probable glutamate--tRNA ligase, mitochondrial n=1 Tax=Mya arenaria TaxID=6604 RepID=UPI0022E8D4EC|nr:probable glutamate--tRNA ligase, mitochondrial [Mya arenaria]XP_052785015.1 probable glutamate--tRNA ligase, mitochondrial [Mya arenaria]